MADQLRPIYRKLKSRYTRQGLMRRHHSLLQRLNAIGGPRKIVFLCYGNICRSPLAAKLAEQRLSGVAIDSAGFHATTGRSSPEKMQRIGSSLGIDLSDHRSARATCELLIGADLVIAMDLENLQRLQSEFPEAQEHTTLLGLFGNPPRLVIADPYLAEEADTRKICEQVQSGIDGLALWLAQTKASTYPAEVPSVASSGH